MPVVSGFDPESPRIDFNEQCRIHAKNATMSLALSEADQIVCPTRFQASTLPSVYQSRVSIIHEGIDVERIRPARDVSVAFPAGVPFDDGAPIITLINRVLEPYRGYHIFMRALPKVLKAVPSAQAVLIGQRVREAMGPSRPKAGVGRATSSTK